MALVSEIEFGISLRLLHGAKDEARNAESLGYDYLLTGEHIMFHGPTANNMVSLAAAAGATERIKLMSGIVLVPLYPAALLAKQVGVLDVVSEGRFSLGVGVGGEFPKEFDAVGVPVKERGARTNEALEVLDLLLREKDVSSTADSPRLTACRSRPEACRSRGYRSGSPAGRTWP